VVDLALITRYGHADLGVGHVLVVDREADDLRIGEGLDEIDFAGRRRHRHLWEVAAIGAPRCVLQDNAVGAAAPDDKARGRECGVTQRALPFNNDHIGVLAFERFDDRGLQLTRTKL
jgi:hypothetical protein